MEIPDTIEGIQKLVKGRPKVRVPYVPADMPAWLYGAKIFYDEILLLVLFYDGALQGASFPPEVVELCD